MVLTVNNLAKTYKLLPSEVMARATTFDLYVLDVSTRFVKYQQDMAQGRAPKTRDYTTGELMAMLKRARGEK